MSWVQAMSSSGEDVFDEYMDDMQPQQNEWRCNMEKRVKDGYRDGIEAGKESALQNGFNQGYVAGATSMKIIGELKGILSALLSWCQMQKMDSGVIDDLKQLLQTAADQEALLLERLKISQQETNVSEVTDDIELLELNAVVQETSCGCCGNSVEDPCNKLDNEFDREHCKKQNLFSKSVECRTFHKVSDSENEHVANLLIQCYELASALNLPAELLQHIKHLGTIQVNVK
ncbi:OTU deubiquitinase with linear linkage specificity a [Polypterus senegalus]